MAVNKDLSIQSMYDAINDLQNKIAKNSQDIAKVESKQELATPKQISNMLIDINNLQHQFSVLSNLLKKTEKDITQLNGKFNQCIIKSNQLSNKITQIQKRIDQRSNKFFSWGTARELLVGIILAIILSIGGNICSNAWSSYIEQQASKRNPQIRFTQAPNLNQPIKK